MKVRVDVMPKEGVLDPQGKAISHALASLGFTGVDDVRAGKVIMLDLAGGDRDRALESAKSMAEKLLANQVIEDYRVTVL
ncbi:MAG TPA: phosphoribosylformylglycinamidine synthase subunit PurS [Alphaproteobacteria bacterium]|nr:phosphoribosylformylglycinamidine synthase subunit PurS [Alphaproteobacteria bacterium]